VQARALWKRETELQQAEAKLVEKQGLLEDAEEKSSHASGGGNATSAQASSNQGELQFAHMYTSLPPPSHTDAEVASVEPSKEFVKPISQVFTCVGSFFPLASRLFSIVVTFASLFLLCLLCCIQYLSHLLLFPSFIYVIDCLYHADVLTRHYRYHSPQGLVWKLVSVTLLFIVVAVLNLLRGGKPGGMCVYCHSSIHSFNDNSQCAWRQFH
jgi:hypothetical protein